MLPDMPAKNFRADMKIVGIKSKNKELGPYQTKEYAKQYKKKNLKKHVHRQKKICKPYILQWVYV